MVISNAPSKAGLAKQSQADGHERIRRVLVRYYFPPSPAVSSLTFLLESRCVTRPAGSQEIWESGMLGCRQKPGCGSWIVITDRADF